MCEQIARGAPSGPGALFGDSFSGEGITLSSGNVRKGLVVVCYAAPQQFQYAVRSTLGFPLISPYDGCCLRLIAEYTRSVFCASIWRIKTGQRASQNAIARSAVVTMVSTAASISAQLKQRFVNFRVRKAAPAGVQVRVQSIP